MAKRTTFFGLQSRLTRPDRLYRVRIADDALLAGYVAGQFCTKERAQSMFAAAEIDFYPLLRGVFLRGLRRRRQRQQAYRKLLADPRAYAAVDRRNFTIERRGVASVTLEQGGSFIRAPDSIATVRIELASGGVRNLLVVGRQNCDDVADILRSVFPDLRITGTPPREKPRPLRRLPSDAKNDRLITAATLFIFLPVGLVSAIFFAEPAWPVTAALLIGAAASAVAAYALIRRWQRIEALKNKKAP